MRKKIFNYFDDRLFLFMNSKFFFLVESYDKNYLFFDLVQFFHSLAFLRASFSKAAFLSSLWWVDLIPISPPPHYF